MSVITPNWKNWTIVVLLIFLSICFMFACNERRARLAAEEKVKSTTEEFSSVVKDIERVKDDKGREHIRFPSNQNIISREMAKESKKLDTVAALLDIKKKDILGYEKTSLVAEAKDLPAKITGTIKRPIYNYEDSTFRVGLRPVADSTKNEYVFNVGANIDLVSTSYRKRKLPIIGSWKYYTDVYATDKRITISGMEKLTIEQPENRFGVRLQATALYGIEDRLLLAGPGIQIDFNRSSTTVSYYYDWASKSWVTVAGLRADLIRF